MVHGYIIFMALTLNYVKFKSIISITYINDLSCSFHDQIYIYIYKYAYINRCAYILYIYIYIIYESNA